MIRTTEELILIELQEIRRMIERWILDEKQKSEGVRTRVGAP